MGPEIRITISPTGEVKVDVNGVIGTSCQDITRALQEALGVEIESQVKPQMYQELDDLSIKNVLGM